MLSLTKWMSNISISGNWDVQPVAPKLWKIIGVPNWVICAAWAVVWFVEILFLIMSGVICCQWPKYGC